MRAKQEEIIKPVPARIKNYVTKTIFAKVISFGNSQAHIYVPSHWRGQIVKMKLIDKDKGKFEQQSFVKDVKNYNRFSCHIPVSIVYIGEIFEITLQNHEELCNTIFCAQK